jgi:5-enolpyruvylshikimate-3-phosphate synthase
MSVMAARTGRSQPRPISTQTRASSSAADGVFMKAPLPALTSRSTRSLERASFFDITLAAISGTEATVAVASRRAYNLPSAGTMSER